MIKIDAIRNNSVYLSGDIELNKRLEQILDHDAGKQIGRAFVYRTNIPGIYTYGLEQLMDEQYGHKAGYIWASRASVMNAFFDTALFEANYKCGNGCYVSCAIDLIFFESILSEYGYGVDFDANVSDNLEDVSYKIYKKI